MPRMGRRRKNDLHLPPRMRRKGGAYYFDCGGKPRKWAALGSDFPTALKKWAELSGKAPAASATLSEPITKYKAIVYPDKALRTLKDNDAEFKMLEAVFGQSPLDSITRRDVERYHSDRGQHARIRANRELALLVGETDFNTLVHQGAGSGLYLQMMANRVILAALYDKKTTLGLVRFQAKRVATRLETILDNLFAKIQAGSGDEMEPVVGAGFAAAAEAELDGLFSE